MGKKPFAIHTNMGKNTQPELTMEYLEKQFNAISDVLIGPQYSILPDPLVDYYLSEGVVPQFVIVSSKSEKKIRDYVKKHPSPPPQSEAGL